MIGSWFIFNKEESLIGPPLGQKKTLFLANWKTTKFLLLMEDDLIFVVNGRRLNLLSLMEDD
jgi:hypothetical protein